MEELLELKNLKTSFKTIRGKVTAVDLSTLNQAILKTAKLKDAEFKAADLDDNKKLTATDLSTINDTILGNITLTYNKNQQNNTSITSL